MPPKRQSLDWPTIFASAREVALTESKPSRAKVANRLGLVESTLNKAAKREGKLDELDAILSAPAPDAPELTEDGPIRSAANDPTPAPWKAEDVIRAHGDDPAECVILRKRGNRWGTPEEPNHQLRVDWVRREDTVQAADPGAWDKPPKPRKPRKDRERRVVICGDQHAPMHDRTMHRLFCDLLADTEPEEGVLLGDLMDFPTISRFRHRDGFAASVNDCLQSAFEILRDYREASPKTHWVMLPGNHDCRLYYAILDNAKDLHRIAPAGEDEPALSFRRLLHLDDLGVELIDDDWESAKFSISRKLTARHGYTTAKNAGDKMLSKLTRSTVQGHSHRASLTFRTEHDPDPERPTETRLAAEVGCMAQVADGLGHAVDPDWQQGVALATIWPDGDFHVAQYIYVPGRLLGPGKRYA